MLRNLFSCTNIMLILWDERKRLANIDKHGLDFRVLNLEFLSWLLLFPPDLVG